MRRFRLLDHEGRAIAEGFVSSNGVVVVLALHVQMSPIGYRTIETMIKDWGRATIDWVDAAEDAAQKVVT